MDFSAVENESGRGTPFLVVFSLVSTIFLFLFLKIYSIHVVLLVGLPLVTFFGFSNSIQRERACAQAINVPLKPNINMMQNYGEKIEGFIIKATLLQKNAILSWRHYYIIWQALFHIMYFVSVKNTWLCSNRGKYWWFHINHILVHVVLSFWKDTKVDRCCLYDKPLNCCSENLESCMAKVMFLPIQFLILA